MSNMIMFHGAGANCGKTTILVGILRYLKNSGYNVAPFKAVSVLEEKEFGVFNPVEHLVHASKLDMSYLFNPIRVFRKDLKTAELYLRNEYIEDIELSTNDTPLLNNLDNYTIQRLKVEITSCLETLESKYDFVLIEGASNPVDSILIEECDLSNFYPLKYKKMPIIVIARAFDGGHWASLYGTISNYPSYIEDKASSIILNDVLNYNDLFKIQLSKICKDMNVKCHGVVPRVNYFDDIERIYPQDFEKEYEVWGKIAKEFIDVKKIIYI